MRDSRRRTPTIPRRDSEKSSEMNGWIVFIWSSGVLGERNATVSEDSLDGMNEYSASSEGLQTYSFFL